MLYRSLLLGLVGAVLLMEATHTAPRGGERRAIAAAPAARAAPTIVDVARGALDAQIDVGLVLGLRPGERVAAIDDAPVGDGREAAVAAIRDAPAGRYLDLDVARAGATRRVLVLVH